MKKQLFSLAVAAGFIMTGCGGGLPSCDDEEAKKIVEDILRSGKNSLSNSYNVSEDNEICYNNIRFTVLFPPPQKEKGKECPSGGEYIQDVDLKLKNYLVESEEFASDNRSVYCKISVDLNLSSDSSDFSYKKRHSLGLRIYEKTEDGSRQYEYNIK